MTDNRTTELLDGLRHVGNLHEFAELFGFDWRDDSDWTWHDVAVKMANDFEQAIAATLGSRTCEQVLADCDDGLMPPFTAHCSACGVEWGFTPKYCHNCGSKRTGTRDERKAVDDVRD